MDVVYGSFQLIDGEVCIGIGVCAVMRSCRRGTDSFATCTRHVVEAGQRKNHVVALESNQGFQVSYLMQLKGLRQDVRCCSVIPMFGRVLSICDSSVSDLVGTTCC